MKADAIRRILGLLVVLTALAQATQAVLMLTISDQRLLRIASEAAIKQRDSKYDTMARVFAPSDEDIERIIQSRKGEVLASARAEVSKAAPIKGVGFAVLAAICYGLFWKKRSPTRVLAWIAFVLLSIGSFYAIREFLESSASGDIYGVVDKCASLTVPVGAIACVIAGLPFIWKNVSTPLPGLAQAPALPVGPVPVPGTVPPGGAASLHLRLSNGRAIALSPGLILRTLDLPGLKPQSSCDSVAVVESHPSDPKVLGLRNLSAQPWDAIVGAQRKHVPPGKVIQAANGTKINFGQTQGEVVA